MFRIIVFFIIGIFLVALGGCEQEKVDHEEQITRPVLVRDGLATIERAFHNRESNLFVESKGIVENVLSDDITGTRHQRFIVRLANGQTLLIAHNIDIAPRIPDVQEGDEIHFRGEYEWNEKGGVVHWTHHDLLMKRAGGWIEHKGKRYQ